MLGAELGYIYTDGIAVDECLKATPQSTTRDYTPTAGVGFFQQSFLKPGDTVEMTAEGIGTLRNEAVG